MGMGEVSDDATVEELKLNQAELARALGVSRQAIYNRLKKSGNTFSHGEWQTIIRHMREVNSNSLSNVLSFLRNEGIIGDDQVKAVTVPPIRAISLADLNASKIEAVIPDFGVFREAESNCLEQLAELILSSDIKVDVFIGSTEGAEEFKSAIGKWSEWKHSGKLAVYDVSIFQQPSQFPFCFCVSVKNSLQIRYLTCIGNQFVEPDQSVYRSIFKSATSTASHLLKPTQLPEPSPLRA